MVQRIKDILFRPTPTWDVIDTEPATVAGLYKSWVVPLAAIPAVCSFIGLTVFGVGFWGIHYRPSIVATAISSVVTYLLTLAMVYVLALIIDALAPSFGGQKNQVQAFKVAAYSGTAAWLAGVFQLVPMLAWLGLAGLYSLYLMWRGLPKLMKTPPEKTAGYVIVVILVCALAWIVIGAVTAPLAGLGRHGGPFASRHDDLSGKLVMPGVGSIDVDKAQEAAERMERAARTGKVELVSTDTLKAALPASAAGFSRGEVETESASAGGFGSASAQADYSRGAMTAKLRVVDISSAGPMAGMAAAFSVEHSREQGGTYEKVGRVNGAMTMEKYDRDARRGEYGVLVGDRFLVQAEGSGVEMADLKRLVGSVDRGALERLAR
jgi:hypothetical protein